MAPIINPERFTDVAKKQRSGLSVIATMFWDRECTQTEKDKFYSVYSNPLKKIDKLTYTEVIFHQHKILLELKESYETRRIYDIFLKH